MKRYYTIPEIAHRLTINSHSNLVSQKTVNKWISQKSLWLNVSQKILGALEYTHIGLKSLT